MVGGGVCRRPVYLLSPGAARLSPPAILSGRRGGPRRVARPVTALPAPQQAAAPLARAADGARSQATGRTCRADTVRPSPITANDAGRGQARAAAAAVSGRPATADESGLGRLAHSRPCLLVVIPSYRNRPYLAEVVVCITDVLPWRKRWTSTSKQTKILYQDERVWPALSRSLALLPNGDS